ncbi:SCO1664 family protein [Euzebya tangerina]|uniref:SCO1664 family protein n=1 Tax=Euzebya tangerina TaxID=591198 RepID=UPI000E323AED|nr:SCO1664 family protein [Euzebya tangerina]
MSASGLSVFDSEAAAFARSHGDGLVHLAEDEITMLGFISSASNGTMLVHLGSEAEQRYAIYKPGQHERPLWDFPGELYLREVAAFEVSAFLGWDLVPPTVVRTGPRGEGSLQLFVPHDPADHYFELVEDASLWPQLVRMAMFDMVCNNADRKGGHVLRRSGADQLYGIDHGLTFHTETKLRTVIWDLPDVPFREEDKDDLRRLERCIAGDEPFARRLHELLTIREVDVLRARCEQVAGMTAMPRIPSQDRWYPWPPI